MHHGTGPAYANVYMHPRSIPARRSIYETPPARRARPRVASAKSPFLPLPLPPARLPLHCRALPSPPPICSVPIPTSLPHQPARNVVVVGAGDGEGDGMEGVRGDGNGNDNVADVGADADADAKAHRRGTRGRKSTLPYGAHGMRTGGRAGGRGGTGKHVHARWLLRDRRSKRWRDAVAVPCR